MKKRHFLLCLPVLALLSGLWGCTLLSPTAAPPTVTLTPTLPSVLVHPAAQCRTTEESQCWVPLNSPPPLCDIVPSVTTLDEARQQLGNQEGYFIEERRLRYLPGFSPLPLKKWVMSRIALFYDAEERVLCAHYRPCELTLGKIVATYGPPELLYIEALCEDGLGLGSDCSASPFDSIVFVWPEWGALAWSLVIDGLYTDSEGHLLSFSPDFGIDDIWYVSPFTLDEFEDHLSDKSYGDEFVWPGFAE